MTYFVHYFRFK